MLRIVTSPSLKLISNKLKELRIKYLNSYFFDLIRLEPGLSRLFTISSVRAVMEMEGQKPPAKGGHLRWGILKPGWGKKYKGWKAGPNWGFKTHHAPRSKPCVAKITAGALSCRWCSPEYPDGFTGYLPIINDEGQKLVLLYGRDFEDIISDIPFGAEIQISKGGYQSAPVIVVQKEWCGHPCPWLGRLKCQHDIRPFLLQLWKKLQNTVSATCEYGKCNDEKICKRLQLKRE